MSFHGSESIIVSFFLIVGECLVGFIYLLELYFLGLVATVTIRMEFHSLFLIGTFDLISTGSSLDAEKGIVFVLHDKKIKL